MQFSKHLFELVIFYAEHRSSQVIYFPRVKACVAFEVESVRCGQSVTFKDTFTPHILPIVGLKR